jgi:hypothetical protein
MDPPYTKYAKKLISMREEDVLRSGKLTVIGPMFGEENHYKGRLEWDEVYSKIDLLALEFLNLIACQDAEDIPKEWVIALAGCGREYGQLFFYGFVGYDPAVYTQYDPVIISLTQSQRPPRGVSCQLATTSHGDLLTSHATLLLIYSYTGRNVCLTSPPLYHLCHSLSTMAATSVGGMR